MSESDTDATGGESEGAPAAGGGGDDLLQQWAIFVTGLFGLVGAGVGLHALVQEQVDSTLVSVDIQAPTGEETGGLVQPGAELTDQLAADAASDPLLVAAPLLGIAGAVLLGAWIGTGLSVPDEEAYKIAGAGAGAGTAVLWAVAGFLVVTSGRVGYEASEIGLGEQVTVDVGVDFGGLLVSAVAAGVVAAAVAAGAVWIARNQAPEDVAEISGGPEDVAAPADD